MLAIGDGASVVKENIYDSRFQHAEELKKMGADIEEKEEGLVIRSSKLKGSTLETYSDHRMVMSLTVAALGAEGESVVLKTESAFKTYPNFKEHMKALGANIR